MVKAFGFALRKLKHSLESFVKKIVKEYWLLFAVAGTVILLDQITKSIVRAYIPFRSSWMPWEWLAPYLRFVHWQNTGAAFGFFQGGGLIFGILAIFVAIFIIYYFPQVPEHEKMMRLALALQLGGAIGNLIDRILFGPVTDFISVGSFPVFNIADSSITIGVGVLILGLWVSEQKAKAEAERSNKKVAAASEGDDQPMEADGPTI